jgi:protein dpy-30
MVDSQQVPIHDDIHAADALQDPSSSSVITTGSGPPRLPSHILQIIDHELASPNVPSLADVQAYPTTAYFNKTVIPIIIEGLAIVAKERPKNPIEFLAAFFIKNKERFGESV